MCDYYVEILLICNFRPSRARNYATTVISKLNNFAEVLAVRVHVDVYMATAALRSLTHETLCDTPTSRNTQTGKDILGGNFKIGGKTMKKEEFFLSSQEILVVFF